MFRLKNKVVEGKLVWVKEKKRKHENMQQIELRVA